jgi:hypothetical protein
MFSSGGDVPWLVLPSGADITCPAFPLEDDFPRLAFPPRVDIPSPVLSGIGDTCSNPGSPSGRRAIMPPERSLVAGSFAGVEGTRPIPPAAPSPEGPAEGGDVPRRVPPPRLPMPNPPRGPVTPSKPLRVPPSGPRGPPGPERSGPSGEPPGSNASVPVGAPVGVVGQTNRSAGSLGSRPGPPPFPPRDSPPTWSPAGPWGETTPRPDPPP